MDVHVHLETETRLVNGTQAAEVVIGVTVRNLGLSALVHWRCRMRHRALSGGLLPKKGKEGHVTVKYTFMNLCVLMVLPNDMGGRTGFDWRREDR